MFTLLARAETQGKRLPLVAATLGGTTAGNVVYANTAAEAEKFGEVIFDALGEAADMSDDPAIADLIELVENTIHRSYRLRKQLQRGVAFHYGNMPLLVRQAIETLFREEKLRYLVCTSTLLEGVNLPCKNLYVRAPRRGTGNPMTAGDFWNLAGRAGQWGIEFQGNIVCVDTTKANTWVNVPTRRERQPITRATDKALASMGEFLNYIAAGTPLSIARENRSFEPTYSYIASWIARGRPLSELSWLGEVDDLPSLTVAVERSLESVTVSADSRTKHAGISPLSMQRLADHLRADPDLAQYVIPLPESDQFVPTIRRILPKIDTFLGGKFGAHEGRHFQLAILISRWVQGQPLSYLISDRVNYFRSSGRDDSTPNVIRSVMADIEEMVRFQAPLYLTCFRDVLQEALRAPFAAVTSA